MQQATIFNALFTNTLILSFVDMAAVNSCSLKLPRVCSRSHRDYFMESARVSFMIRNNEWEKLYKALSMVFSFYHIYIEISNPIFSESALLIIYINLANVGTFRTQIRFRQKWSGFWLDVLFFSHLRTSVRGFWLDVSLSSHVKKRYAPSDWTN
jgi:hypothetical protein